MAGAFCFGNSNASDLWIRKRLSTGQVRKKTLTMFYIGGGFTLFTLPSFYESRMPHT